VQVLTVSTSQEERQEPSPQRWLPTGQVTCVGHTSTDTTHSPPLQRNGVAAGQAGIAVHCCAVSTQEPDAQRTGEAAEQAERVGQSISWPRQDPSGQRMGAATGQEGCGVQVVTSAVHVMPSAQRIGVEVGHAVVDGQRAVSAATRAADTG